LVIADKGWTHLLFYDLRERLMAAGLRCEYIDGRPTTVDSPSDENGVMVTAISQLRRAVRGSVEGVVVGLPHLDVMAAAEGGWTNVAREVVPFLYEAPQAVLIGFCDPTLTLLPVVDKLFSKRFVVDQSFGKGVESGPVVAADQPFPSEPHAVSAEHDKPSSPADQPRD